MEKRIKTTSFKVSLITKWWSFKVSFRGTFWKNIATNKHA